MGIYSYLHVYPTLGVFPHAVIYAHSPGFLFRNPQQGLPVHNTVVKYPQLARTSQKVRTAVSRCLIRLFAIVGLAVLSGVPLASIVEAAPPPVTPIFPHNVTLQPGRLYFRQVGLTRNGHIDWHNGSLYTANVTGSPRREFRFSTASDPSSLFLFSDNNTVPIFSEHDTHGHTKSGPWLGDSIMRSGVNVNSFVTGAQKRPAFSQPKPAGATGGRTEAHGIYYPWRLPFHWSQYGDSNGYGWIYRGDTLLHQWDLLGQTGILGNSILLGNHLFIVSHEEALGAYLAAPWEHYIILVRRDTNVLQMVDISDPTNLRLSATIPLHAGGNNVPYVQFQDHYAFVWGQKVNLNTRQVELVLDSQGNGTPDSSFEPKSAFVARPAGSAQGPLDVSQYNLPLGNLLVTGGYSTTNADGIGVWAHQAAPDTKNPYVGYHLPRDGQTNFPLGAPISLLIHETLESYTIINGDTVILRKLGTTTPVDCWTSFSHDDVLTLTPKSYLDNDSTYEVVVLGGGIKDASGNGIEPYTFTFSTGATASGGNRSPVINSFTVNTARTTAGTARTFSVSASDSDNDSLQYRFIAGDGAEATAWGTTTTFAHTYAATGHYDAKIQVRDLKPGGATSQVSRTITVTAAPNPPATSPTSSGPVTLDSTTNRRVFTVNPDSDSVTAVHADTLVKLWERDLNGLLGLPASQSVDPRNVALDNQGRLWVSGHDIDAVLVLNATNGDLVQVIDLGYGSAPFGVLASPDRATIFVTTTARGATNPTNGQVIRFSASTRAETGRRELGPTARAMALTSDGTRLLVSRFISAENHGQIWEVNASTMALTRTISLQRDRGGRGFDSGSTGKGVPNYVASITISPDNQWAWYTAQKANTQRGELFRQNGPTNVDLSPESTVRALVGRVSLVSNNEPNVDSWTGVNGNIRIDVDNSESPVAVAFSDRGDYAFVAVQGNNFVAVYDHLALLAGGPGVFNWRIPVGAAPQGLVLDHASRRLFVQNLMSRDLSAQPVGAFLDVGDRTAIETRVSTVATEKLPSSVLLGKKVFYHASDQMSRETYMSCATCHVDGSHDGRTYDFTQRGEGLRNTTDLRGRSGLGHGRVHWSGNFDEVQDFILDIVDHFGGTGFLPANQTPNSALGTPNAGRSTELDALAAYVSSLNADALPSSPHRATDGAVSDAALRGAALFAAQSCVDCHQPSSGYTDSTTLSTSPLHNVGTLRTSSGKRLDATLTGIDTPTLLGLWSTAPYFHDGSAETLGDVFRKAGGTVVQAESATLSGASLRTEVDIVYNWDQSTRGYAVEFPNTGARATFSQVDGGTGGTGAVELRYESSAERTVRLIVNGVTFTEVVPATAFSKEWRRVYFPAVTLIAGATNTIIVESGSGSFNLDEITVTRPNEFNLALPHRRVLSLTSAQQADLTAYLLQLDSQSTALREPDAPASTVLGVNYDFHQFTTGLSNTDGLTTTNKVSSGTSTSTLSALPGQTADSDDEYYGLVYTGYISVPTDGTYTFYTNSDDGNKLQIGTTTVASDESPHGARWNTNSVPIALKAGKHAFTLKFYENGGGDSLRIEYAGPGITRTELPASALFRAGTAVTTPTISTQPSPSSRTVTVGANVTYTVAANANGGTLSYQWKRGTTNVGTNSATLTLNNVSSANAGSYTVVVTNSAGSVTSNAVTLAVSTPPTAFADHDRTVSTGSAVTLAGSGSVQLGSVSYAWTQTSGPVTVTLTGANTATASFTPTVAGTYTFTLTTTANGASTTDTVTIVVTAPLASHYWGGGTTTPTASVNTTAAAANLAGFAGTWNATTTNWNANPAATTGWSVWDASKLARFKSSSSVNGTAAGTPDVALAADFTAAGLVAEFTNTSAFNQQFDLISDNATNRTITLPVGAVITQYADNGSNNLAFRRAGHVSGRGGVNLGGTGGFTFSGLTIAGAATGVSSIFVESATISGPVRITSGQLNIGAGSAGATGMPSANTFSLLGNLSVLKLIYGAAAENRIADTAELILASGMLQLNAHSNTVGNTETVGGVTLEGSGWISTETRGWGAQTVSSTLAMAGAFDRGDNGKGLLITTAETTDGALGTTTGLNITGHGFGNNAFIAYGVNQGAGYNVATAASVGTAGSARFLATDASGKLGVANSTAGNPTLSNSAWQAFTSASDVHVDNATLTGAFAGNVTARSLALGNNATGNQTLGLGGFTLSVGSFAWAPASGTTFALGTNDANRGTLTAPGSELYVINQRYNAAITAGLTVNAAITGAKDVIFGGATADITLNAPNTYTGRTFVNGGKVTLSSTGSVLSTTSINVAQGALFVANAANLTLGGGTVAQTLAGGGNLQADSRTVTIGALGSLAPGDTGANDTFTLALTTGKLAFVAGSKVKLDLGAPTLSDVVAFTTAGDWLMGSGNATLELTLGSGFDYTKTYVVMRNVTTSGFTFANVTGYNTTNYTARVGRSGNDIVISFEAIP